MSAGPPLIFLIGARGTGKTTVALLLAEALGLRALTVFHVWRIAAALLFFWYGARHLLPETFVRDAAWGDKIMVGGP